MTTEQFSQLIWEIRCCGLSILLIQLLIFYLTIRAIKS